MGERYTIKNEWQLGEFISRARRGFEEDKSITFEIISDEKTTPQHNAIFLWCEMMAEELNNKGITVLEYFNEGTDIPWTKERYRENVWKYI